MKFFFVLMLAMALIDPCLAADSPGGPGNVLAQDDLQKEIKKELS